MAKEKDKAAEAAEKRAQSAEKARLVAVKKLTEVEAKLGSTDLKLAEAESLNLAQADEVADLKAALDACENKWYNKGFANAENFVEPIVHQARHHRFGEGWLAALQAIGVAEDSPLRNPEHIPYPAPPPPVQSQVIIVDEEDTLNMRELVQTIDTHMEMVDLEVTSNLNAIVDVQAQQLPSSQPIEEPPTQPAKDAALSQSSDPVA